ncbi:hypothetical protein [Mesomycoplasma molare]|uniref:Uncharacterized protein n=1 Tax=Mesomycoplasma molare TaxID=171288 RepID=A0ABY5TV26_9BACT|nr:hypothetical protein [Mesomycoplasma molare]UWD34520.1 hypothetical protein NX772_01670 [Mesomycoplasma molare]
MTKKIFSKKTFFKKIGLIIPLSVSIFSFVSMSENASVEDENDLISYKEKIKTNIENSLKNKITSLYEEAKNSHNTNFPTKESYEKLRFYENLSKNFSLVKNSFEGFFERDFQFLIRKTYISSTSGDPNNINDENTIINTLTKEEKKEILNDYELRIINIYIVFDSWLKNQENFPIYGEDFSISDKEITEIERNKLIQLLFKMENRIRNFSSENFIAKAIRDKLIEHRTRDRKIIREESLKSEMAFGKISIKKEALEKNAFLLKKSDIFIENKNNLLIYSDNFKVVSINETESTEGKILELKTTARLNNVHIELSETFEFDFKFNDYFNLYLNRINEDIKKNKTIYLKKEAENKLFKDLTIEDFYHIKSEENDYDLEIKSIEKVEGNEDLSKAKINYSIIKKFTENDFEVVKPNLIENKIFEDAIIIQNIRTKKDLNLDQAKELNVILTDKGKKITASQAKYFTPLEQIAFIEGDRQGFIYKIKNIRKKENTDGTIGIVEIEISNGINSKKYQKELEGFLNENSAPPLNGENNLSEEEKNEIYSKLVENQPEIFSKFLDSSKFKNLSEKEKNTLATAALLFKNFYSKENLEKIINNLSQDEEFEKLSKEEKELKIKEAFNSEILEMIMENKEILQKSFDLSSDKKIENIKELFEDTLKIDSSISNDVINKIKEDKEKILDNLNNLEDKETIKKIIDSIYKINEEERKILFDNGSSFLENINPFKVKNIKNKVEQSILWSILAISSTTLITTITSIGVLIAKNKAKIKNKLSLFLSMGIVSGVITTFVIVILLELLR